MDSAPYAFFKKFCVDRLGVSAPHLEVSALPYPYVRGLVCASAGGLPAGATLCSVPLPALLTAACAAELPHLRNFFSRLAPPVPLSEDDTLALTLLFEQHVMGEKSRWAAYLRTLPAAYDLPFCWSDEEVDALRGAGAHALALRMRAQLGEDWAALRGAVDACARDTGFSSAEAFTLERYRWAMCTVWSRGVSLQLGGAGAPPAKALAPFFDLFNTADGAPVRHYFDAKRRALVAVADAPVAAGAQVCLNYGHASSRALLQLHGFVLPGAAAECYQLEMSFRSGGDAALDRARLALHGVAPPVPAPGAPREEEGLLVAAPEGLFATFQLHDGVWNAAMARFLRVQLCKPGALEELGSALKGDPDAAVDVELEAEILQLLARSFVEILKELGERPEEAPRLAALGADAAAGAVALAAASDALRAALEAGAAGCGSGGDDEEPSLLVGGAKKKGARAVGGGGGGGGGGAAAVVAAAAAAAEAPPAASAPPPPPAYSAAAEDARERRLQYAAYARRAERRVLEGQLMMVEGAMQSLKETVEGFYAAETAKEGAAEAASGGGGGGGGDGCGGAGRDSPPPLS